MKGIIPLYGHLAGALPRPVVENIYALPPVTRALRTGLGRLVPEGPIEERVVAGPLRGACLPIYPRNEVSFISGLWEFWVADALRACLRAGDVAWDVGAYIGYFTLLMRRLCGPDRVLALEPDSGNAQRLRRALSINGAHDVEVLEAAAGAGVGRLVLSAFSGHPAASAAGAGGHAVSVTTLDSLAATRTAPRLIKLDVEGDEGDVLDGAQKLVSEIRPLWIIELHGSGGIRAEETLRSSAYRIRRLNRLASATHQEHILAVP